MHTLDLDIGNSFCKWQLRDDLLVVERGRLNLDRQGCAEFAAAMSNVNSVNYCSVAHDREIEYLLSALALPKDVKVCAFKTSHELAGLTNSYANPAQMGSDRWLASVAARLMYPNRHICVVDCGSAVNVEFVSATGVHTGGYIIPGLTLMRDSLRVKTANVKVEERPGSEALAPGLCTADNVNNGTLLALVALVERLKAQMADIDGLLILAGGDAPSVAAQLQSQERVVMKERLVLQGFVELARAGVSW